MLTSQPNSYIQRLIVKKKKMGSKTLFHFFLCFNATLHLLITLTSSTPPQDPIKCSSPNNTNCTITNTYGAFPDLSTCRASRAAYPTTEQQLIAVVANATRSGHKMKVATSTSHSIPKLVCLDDGDSINGVLISTKYLNRVLAVDKVAMTMTVESGVTLRKLVDEAAKAGMALPYSPYWWGLTVGGMLGTGAHGSSLWREEGTAVHDFVVGVSVVSPGVASDGYVKVRTLKENDADINAVKVSLGVLGVVYKVTFELEAMFKRSVTFVLRNDTNLGDESTKFGREHEFADLSWYPSQGKVVYRIDDRVASTTTGNGLNDHIPFRSTLATTAYGLTNNGFIFTGYPIVGFQNRIQASGTCLDSSNDGFITACAWDSRIRAEFFHQTTFSVALSVLKDFILDVQKLINIDPDTLCMLDQYNGILMRYITSSTAYLGKQEDALDFDITYYRSKDPMQPRLYEDVLEEIEQMALFKYGALPHWGKNRNLAFVGAIDRYNKSGEFLKVKERYDPLGLFSSEWTDQVLGLRGGLTTSKEGCALEGMCICSEDSHCAPNDGYFCRPGKVYKDARVCTYIDDSSY
ncbi:Probable L-gulonolactone oxidase 6 [Linum perenne]